MSVFTTQEIEDLAAKAAAIGPFRPFAHYCAETDSLEFFASNDSAYARSLDSLVTVYLHQETDAVIGIRLKKVKMFIKDLLQKSPGFKSEIRDHRIKLEHLFTAKIWASVEQPNDARVLTYRRLRDLAKANDVEAVVDDLLGLAS